MHFEITHRTSYRYSLPVSLEPHTLRLRPRSDGAQRLVSWDVAMSPEPAGMSECTDTDGNAALLVWFNGYTDRLDIKTHFTLETLRDNPFDYVITSGAVQLPMMGYAPEVETALDAYRKSQGIQKTVCDFAAEIATEADWQVVPFLTLLTDRLHKQIKSMVRLTGHALTSAETLAQGEGACRDTAVLFIDLCRSLGLAARFVSGYHPGFSETEERHLHAWAEVYLHGAGWRGYDPSYGVAVSDKHIAVAAAYTPALAAPVTGLYRSHGASSTFTAEIGLVMHDMLPAVR
ncbi:MAG: transglutaminase family protein [Rhizobacter sp.]|nr:transglutaminase family protein [Chlorobiales bacterium]